MEDVKILMKMMQAPIEILEKDKFNIKNLIIYTLEMVFEMNRVRNIKNPGFEYGVYTKDEMLKHPHYLEQSQQKKINIGCYTLLIKVPHENTLKFIDISEINMESLIGNFYDTINTWLLENPQEETTH